MKERKTIRLKGYDYSSDNLYFVTSCVHNRICCFGEIVGTGRDPSLHHGEYVSIGTGRDLSLQSSILRMVLNDYGKIAEQQWHWLGEQYPYIVLHEFVVMPNHIHGIIEINRTNSVGTGRDPSLQNDDDVSVRTGRDLSLQSSIIKIKPLSELMGAYKTTVSKHIHLSGFIEFKWQRSFYEHIIHDEKSFETISDYILNNPVNWEQDTLFNL